MSSKHKRKHAPEHAAPAAPAPARVPGPELLRRSLLALVTALIVARPLIPGEDPGILGARTSTSHLWLTVLWLLALAGWAAWRWWARRPEWHCGLVETGLLAAVLAIAVSTSAARYKHPAVLVAWEWITLVVALFLVRQLATGLAEQRRLVAVFLASVVSLSAYAVWQHNDELPRQQREPLEPACRQAAATVGAGQAGLLPLLDVIGAIADKQTSAAEDQFVEDYLGHVARPEDGLKPYSTFGHPSTFVGFVLLFLPAIVVAAFLRRREGRLWATGVTAVCGLLAILALWQALGPDFNVLRNRSDYWASAREMIEKNPWLGVGAGNFGRVYPSVMQPGAYENIVDPHNFIVELWATYGVFALGGVMLALVGFFWLVLGRARRESNPPAEEAPQEPGVDAPRPPGREPARLEFYAGGMAGLVLGFLLRFGSQSPDDLMMRGPVFQVPEQWIWLATVASIRAAIWFAAFALFEGIRWPARTLSLALAAGVALLLVHLCFWGGISFPNVALPLWVAVGVALAARGVPGRRLADSSVILRALPVAVALGFLIAYYFYLFYPVNRAAGLARAAARAAWFYRGQKAQNYQKIRVPRQYLWDEVIQPLRAAARTDPANARWQVHLATWMPELWWWHRPDPRLGPGYAQSAIASANEAQALDPYGRDGYEAQYRLHLLFARSMAKPAERLKQLDNAAEALRRLKRYDRTDPHLYYRLAEVLFEAGKKNEALNWAKESRRLDDLATRAPRRLGEGPRARLERWLAAPP